MITASQLLTATLAWLPSDGADMPEREATMAAIVRATTDDAERALLAVVATEEGLFDSRVRTCQKTGDHGRSVGPFQTSWGGASRLRRAICTDLAAAARRALTLIHASENACRFQRPERRHSSYATGRCVSRVGWAISERRFNRAAEAVRASKEKS